MREEKQLYLQEVKGKIDQSKGLIFTSYKALEPNKSFEFRSHLKKTGAGFGIVKKRVLLKALEQANVKVNLDQFVGNIGVIYLQEDVVSTTRSLSQFRKDNEDLMAVLFGHLEGRICSANDIEQISKLPSKEEMRAQFLGLLEAPMAQTLATMDALLCSVVHCVQNKVDQQPS